MNKSVKNHECVRSETADIKVVITTCEHGEVFDMNYRILARAVIRSDNPDDPPLNAYACVGNALLAIASDEERKAIRLVAEMQLRPFTSPLEAMRIYGGFMQYAKMEKVKQSLAGALEKLSNKPGSGISAVSITDGENGPMIVAPSDIPDEVKEIIEAMKKATGNNPDVIIEAREVGNATIPLITKGKKNDTSH